MAFALTFNPTATIIVFALSVLAYGFIPQLFVLINGLAVSLLIYEFSDNLIISLSILLLTFLGLFEFRRRRDALNSITAFEGSLNKLKLFVVTPIFLIYFAAILLFPALLNVADVVRDVALQKTDLKQISTSEAEGKTEFTSMRELEMFLFIKGQEYDNVKGGYAADICIQSHNRTGQYTNPYNENNYATLEVCTINVYVSFITESLD